MSEYEELININSGYIPANMEEAERINREYTYGLMAPGASPTGYSSSSNASAISTPSAYQNTSRTPVTYGSPEYNRLESWVIGSSKPSAISSYWNRQGSDYRINSGGVYGGGWVPGQDTKPTEPNRSGSSSSSDLPSIRYGSSSAVPRGYGYGYNSYNPTIDSYLRSFNPNRPLEYKAVPTFSAPVYDEARARRIGREQAAPYIAEVQNAVNRGVARLFGRDYSPATKEAARGLMSGVSEGINKAQATGAAYGRQVYGDIFNRENEAARMNYEAQVRDVEEYNQWLRNTAMTTYQAALQNMRAMG